MKQNGLATILIVILIAVGLGGFLIYSQQPKPTPPQKPVVISQTPQPTPTSSSTPDTTTNWKTYRNEKYGFEFQYPTTWKVDEDTHTPFVQLQTVENGKTVAISGGIRIITKPIFSPIESPYKKMFVSNSQCPVAAGSRNLSNPSQYEEYVYCLTGKEIPVNSGTWKGTVECSTSQWYGEKVDPSSCAHEFWIDTKDFFYVVHFNFFEPIKNNSNEAVFFEKFLKGFSFFTPGN